METFIRQPLLNEYPVLIDIWETSVRATHHFLTEKDIDIYRELITSCLPVVEIYCAADESGLIGFISISEGMIQSLFIRPEARGKGIGKQLMNFAIVYKKITKVDVNEQNAQAFGFYEKLGFKVTGRSEIDGAGKPYPILLMELV